MAATPIEVKYSITGGPGGFLGAPTTIELATPDGIGRYQHYQNGSIYWSPRTEAHEIHGFIRGKWAELGWERSFLGYPLTDELASSDGSGRYSRFLYGMIYWTPQGGAKVLANPIQNISLVKEHTRPQVYFICGDSKLWISSPQEFNAVGFNWNMVQVVPDGALDNYRYNLFSAPASIKPSDVFFDCGESYGWPERWHPNCQNSNSLVRKDVIVAGWLLHLPIVNNHNDDNTLTPHGVEDVFYDIELDPDFIDRMYGKGGLSKALNGMTYHGKPAPVPPNPMSFESIGPDGSRHGVTVESFILAGGSSHLHGELNAWHVDNTGGLFSGRHFVGRGAAPAGWRLIAFENDPNVWWPFDIYNPDQGSRQLLAGDYVIVKGALWQDGHGEIKDIVNDPWHRGSTRGHEGWTEIHPVDWVVRVKGPEPSHHKTVASVAHIAPKTGAPPMMMALEISPHFKSSSLTTIYTVGGIRDLIDGRATDMDAISNYSIINNKSNVVVQGMLSAPVNSLGRFKATYIVDWRETDRNDVVWVEDTVPAGSTTGGELDGWWWTNSNPPPFSGNVAHQSGAFAGPHQHYFFGATDTLVIQKGDTLFAHIHLDPGHIPYEIMLQWNDGSWEHRAYWGANVIEWGVNDSPGRRYMGPVVTAGQWERLEVPASLVGLEGRTLNGMAFTLFGGRATWDRAGKGRPLALQVSLQPAQIQLNKLMQLTVLVHNLHSGNPVLDAQVHIRNFSSDGRTEMAEVHNANLPFSTTFYKQRFFDLNTRKWLDGDFPSCTVTAEGYPDAYVRLF